MIPMTQSNSHFSLFNRLKNNTKSKSVDGVPMSEEKSTVIE